MTRPGTHHALPGMLALAAFQFFAITNAAAMNKCIVDDRPVYQDAPCSNAAPTVGDNLAQQQNAVLYQKLDKLAAQGRGMVQQQAAPVQVANPQSAEPSHSRKSKEQIIAERHQQLLDQAEKSEENNARSAARLTHILDTTKKTCGDKMIDYPTIGMSDETFRNCTTHARFGVITQVVVSADGSTPLRLYIFQSERAQRVYSVGGVITAIRP